VRITWYATRPTNSAVKRMAAARAGINMRTPGSEQDRRGGSRVMLAIRQCRYSCWGALEQLTAWSWSLRLRIQWGSSRVRQSSRHQAQERNTPVQCEAAATILASEGPAPVSVSRQYARNSSGSQCISFFSFFGFRRFYLVTVLSGW